MSKKEKSKKSEIEELVQKYLNAKGIMEKKMLLALIKRIDPDYKVPK